ncbi:hypothetical protein ACFXTI_040896 [Malus domestica]
MMVSLESCKATTQKNCPVTHATHQNIRLSRRPYVSHQVSLSPLAAIWVAQPKDVAVDSTCLGSDSTLAKNDKGKASVVVEDLDNL